LNLTIVY